MVAGVVAWWHPSRRSGAAKPGPPYYTFACPSILAEEAARPNPDRGSEGAKIGAILAEEAARPNPDQSTSWSVSCEILAEEAARPNPDIDVIQTDN